MALRCQYLNALLPLAGRAHPVPNTGTDDNNIKRRIEGLRRLPRKQQAWEPVVGTGYMV